jgi:hypothetical protein
MADAHDCAQQNTPLGPGSRRPLGIDVPAEAPTGPSRVFQARCYRFLHGATASGAASRAARASVPNDRCVMAISSTRMLNSLARAVRLSRTCARARRAGRGQGLPREQGGGQRARRCSCRVAHCAAGGCAGASMFPTAAENLPLQGSASQAARMPCGRESRM